MLYTLSDMDMREDAVACPAMDRQAWLSCWEHRARPDTSFGGHQMRSKALTYTECEFHPNRRAPWGSALAPLSLHTG